MNIQFAITDSQSVFKSGPLAGRIQKKTVQPDKGKMKYVKAEKKKKKEVSANDLDQEMDEYMANREANGRKKITFD